MKSRNELLDEALPQFESFIESREKYIKALETTIQALRQENANFNKNNLAIRSSIDELVAMQRLSNIVSTAVSPETILATLFDLTQQVIPVLESNIFLLDSTSNTLLPLAPGQDPRLKEEAQQQLESGICDWVFDEKKTVIIPDLDKPCCDRDGKEFCHCSPHSAQSLYRDIPDSYGEAATGFFKSRYSASLRPCKSGCGGR